MVRKREGRILQYLVLVVMVFIWGWPGNSGFSQEAKTYVGSEACKGCHEAEYKNFKTYAKKANSFKSVASMKKGLTEAEYRSCLECHTTGYASPAGSVLSRRHPISRMQDASPVMVREVSMQTLRIPKPSRPG